MQLQKRNGYPTEKKIIKVLEGYTDSWLLGEYSGEIPVRLLGTAHTYLFLSLSTCTISGLVLRHSLVQSCYKFRTADSGATAFFYIFLKFYLSFIPSVTNYYSKSECTFINSRVIQHNSCGCKVVVVINLNRILHLGLSLPSPAHYSCLLPCVAINTCHLGVYVLH